jgi:hypothetical protein
MKSHTDTEPYQNKKIVILKKFKQINRSKFIALTSRIIYPIHVRT